MWMSLLKYWMCEHVCVCIHAEGCVSLLPEGQWGVVKLITALQEEMNSPSIPLISTHPQGWPGKV